VIDPETAPKPVTETQHQTPLAIFLAFSQIALSGFGGTAFWTRLVLLEKRKWLSHAEYVGHQSLAHLLPGPNVFNMAVIIGHRLAGIPGSLAALSGIIVWPFVITLAAGALYQRYGQMDLVQRGLHGVSVVAAGLVIANGLRLSSVLPKHWRPWLFLALAFVAIGVLRLPLIAAVAGLGAAGMALAWRERP
jgi:chromate transporter